MPVIVMNLLHVGILGYRHTCLHPAQDTDTCYGTALLHLLCISQIRVKVIGVVGVLQRKAFGSSRLDFFGCLPNSLRSVFILFISFGSTWGTKFLSDAAYKHNHTGSYANICIKGKVLWMKHVERAVLRRGLHSVPNNASVLNSSASRSLPWEISNPAV